MSSNTKFLVDANILVEAYKRYYSFDIAPSFWNALKSNAASGGQVVSIDRIHQEINKYGEDDQLKTWVNQEIIHCFMSTDDAGVFAAYRVAIDWAAGQAQFTAAAKSEFADVADSWLIACAMANNYTLVTHERFNAEVRKRIPIPNVCEALGIAYINTFDMMRRLNVQI